MKNKVKRQVISRLKEGEEPSEIVKEFIDRASQGTIYNWIREYQKAHGLGDFEEPNELEGLDDDLDGFEDDLEGLDEDDLGDLNESATQFTKTLNGSDLDKIGMKRRVFKRAKGLFKEIIAHSDGHTWGRKQLKRMQSTLDVTQDNVEALCNYDKECFEDLSIWVGLDRFSELFQDLAAAGNNVELSFDEDLQELLHLSIEIEDFDEDFDHADYFENRFKRLTETLSEYDNVKITENQANELRSMVDELADELKQGIISDENKKDALIGISRDLKNVSDKAAESFWQNALFVLDDELIKSF